MSEVKIQEVDKDDAGQRLDRWFKKYVPEFSYVSLQKLMRTGQIRVDGKRVKPDYRIEAGQKIRIPPLYSRSNSQSKGTKNSHTKNKKLEYRITKQDKEFMRSLVIYEDEHIIALNKPAGIASQGGSNIKKHIDGLLGALVGKNKPKPRLVHRLDKDTSGVLIVAKSYEAAQNLGRVFKSKDIKKIYWSIVCGVPEEKEAAINAPLIKASQSSMGDKEKVVVDDKEGKPALTEYKVLEELKGKAAFVCFWPKTGRTHQIRVHAALMGCPIYGDGKYGGQDAQIEGFDRAKRIHLHAARLIIGHPINKKILDLHAPLPQDLKNTWDSLGFDSKYNQDPFL